MTNKPNTDKTIEQIRDELANKTYPMQVVNGADWNTSLRVGFNTGFDAAIQLCEQRERDLVSALKNARIGLQAITEITFTALCEEIDEALKHRGENEKVHSKIS